MCRFQIKELYNKNHNLILREKINTIPVGSRVFIKWYDLKIHKQRYTYGALVAKRGKGTSSHVIIRRRITKEVITTLFYLYSATFLGIGVLANSSDMRKKQKAKQYNLLLHPIRWKYL